MTLIFVFWRKSVCLVILAGCDTDTVCLQEENKLESLVPVLAGLGYTLQPAQPYSWKIFHSRDSEQIKNDFYTHRYPFCDVFVMREVRGRYVLRDKTGQNAWPSEYYSKQQVDISVSVSSHHSHLPL